MRGKVRIRDREIDYNRYLKEEEVRNMPKSLRYSIGILLLGYKSIGKQKPEGFKAPTEFYLVRDRERYYISYRQGWSEAFYINDKK